MKSALFTPALFALLTVSVPLHLAAADGRIPIASAPYTITTPGHYYLTQNLSLATTGSALIAIQSDNVDLDLNGCTLTHTGGGNTYGIQVLFHSHITIHDGGVRGAYDLVYLYSSSAAVLVNDVRVQRLQNDNASTLGNAVYALANNGGQIANLTLEDCQIVNAPGHTSISGQNLFGARITGNDFRSGGTAATSIGINLTDVTGSEFSRNHFTGLSRGINLQRSAATASGNLIADNVITYSTQEAIGLYNADGNVIRGNALAYNATGLTLTGNTVSGMNVGASGTQNVYGRNRSIANGPSGLTNYVVVAGNRSAGDNCDQTVCTN